MFCNMSLYFVLYSIKLVHFVMLYMTVKDCLCQHGRDVETVLAHALLNMNKMQYIQLMQFYICL